MRRFIVVAASWFGTGYSPVISGTVGTAAAIPLYLVLSRLSLPLYLLTAIAFTLFACWVSGLAGQFFHEHDSSKIVIDEVAGYLVTMTAVSPSWTNILLGFLLFRFFDITKVPPARFFDRQVKNGYGVVLDDIIAGIYSCIALHVIMALL